MTRTEWDFDNAIHDDARDDLRPKSSEDLIDELGLRAALLALCIASLFLRQCGLRAAQVL